MPQHAQSQRSVEKANSNVKNSLVAWMCDKNTCSQFVGPEIPAVGNNHDAIKIETYKALFGYTHPTVRH